MLFNLDSQGIIRIRKKQLIIILKILKMSGFTNKTFIKHDDYMTPKSAWENIQQFIPRDKIIWEAFFGDGKSGRYLEELGFDVIHKEVDFFENDLGDIIVSNCPFSQTKEIFKRLLVLDKPFILLLPVSKMNTSYFREWKNKINEKDFQIIIPPKRIHFEKHVDGKVPDKWKSSCNFDCHYYCYKMGLEKDITWGEENSDAKKAKTKSPKKEGRDKPYAKKGVEKKKMKLVIDEDTDDDDDDDDEVLHYRRKKINNQASDKSDKDDGFPKTLCVLY